MMTVGMPTISRDFVLAGKSTFTLELPDMYALNNGLKSHYTFKVNFKEGQNGYKDTYFVKFMNGADNENSYSYLGVLDPESGIVRTTSKSCMASDSLIVRLLNRTISVIWSNNTDKLRSAGFNACHAGKCGRCGRKLTNPESLATGIGPECGGKNRKKIM